MRDPNAGGRTLVCPHATPGVRVTFTVTSLPSEDELVTGTCLVV